MSNRGSARIVKTRPCRDMHFYVGDLRLESIVAEAHVEKSENAIIPVVYFHCLAKSQNFALRANRLVSRSM